MPDDTTPSEQLVRETVNTHDQCKMASASKPKAIVLCLFVYGDNSFGRAPNTGSKVSIGVFRNGVAGQVADKKAPWYDDGAKTWLFGHRGSIKERRQVAVDAAREYAMEKFGARDFVRNRQGDWVERWVNESFPLRKRSKA